MNYYLGIDTSAYTTSLALVDENRQIVFDEREMLKVELGERGLRQSEALFLHVKNLPFLFSRMAELLPSKKVRALAASAWPRSVKDSYMPVFTAGFSLGSSLSSFSALPFYSVSHQEGHIMAGLPGNFNLLHKESFLAVHFSGGTSEVLKVTRRGESRSFFTIELLAKGLDLHAGQLVDRIGVALGLPFPSGPYLEELARNSSQKNIPIIPAAVNQQGFSFSGAETRARALIEQAQAREDIAFALFRCLANTLEKVLLTQSTRSGIKDVLLVGGVMANTLIKERLIKRLEHPVNGLKLYFAPPRLSSDNAVGVALLAAFIDQSKGE